MTQPVFDAAASTAQVLAAALVLAAAGCASQPAAQQAEVGQFQRQQAQQQSLDELNALIAQRSSTVDEPAPESYVVGPGDLLKVQVFGVEDLAREVRVDGQGDITLPLIDEVHVGGKTVRAVEELVAARYSEDYLRDPQINVLVEEYRARRITVLGAVKEPKVYSVERNLTVVEALAMAGGLDQDAGRTVYVSDIADDPQQGKRTRRNLIINLDQLLHGNDAVDGAAHKRLNVRLGEGAVVNVPRAGVVYVEGAVEKPGVYTMQGDTSVLKAVAMAGGLKYEARSSGIAVLRTGLGGQAAPVGYVDLDDVRTRPQHDIALQDGDVVVVGTNQLKAGVSALFRGVRGLFGFGYTLN